MELLLNLAWLLLVLPAYILWRNSRTQRKITPMQCLLTLGCMLVILFPVISASDDLHAMQAEMEESPAGKRCVCHAHSEKSSSAKSHIQPVLASASFAFVPIHLAWHSPAVASISIPAAPAIRPIGRAPPTFLA
jgi:hypothetical protein